jgi:hypothetical protein
MTITGGDEQRRDPHAGTAGARRARHDARSEELTSLPAATASALRITGIGGALLA